MYVYIYIFISYDIKIETILYHHVSAILQEVHAEDVIHALDAEVVEKSQDSIVELFKQNVALAALLAQVKLVSTWAFTWVCL